jgi:hypothetical protein
MGEVTTAHDSAGSVSVLNYSAFYATGAGVGSTPTIERGVDEECPS